MTLNAARHFQEITKGDGVFVATKFSPLGFGDISVSFRIGGEEITTYNVETAQAVSKTILLLASKRVS